MADGIVASSAKSGDAPGTGQAAAGKTTSPVPARGKAADRSAPETASPAAGGGDESLGKTVRKMWENPAGKAMMNQGVKMAVAHDVRGLHRGPGPDQGRGGILQDPPRQGHRRPAGDSA